MRYVPEIVGDLARHAYRVGNGEVFWPLSIASAAAEAVAAGDLAIVAGEIYFGRGRAWGNLEVEWTVEPSWRLDERWSTFAARSLAMALAAIADTEGRMSQGLLPAAHREPMCFFAVDHGPVDEASPTFRP